MTLDMTSSQRVEGIFSVLKQGHILRRNSTFREVRAKCQRVAEELVVAPKMYVGGRLPLGNSVLFSGDGPSKE